jgi:hypothetical protein
VDYRSSSETLARKLTEAGNDSWQLLGWLRQAEQGSLAAGAQAQLLARVFNEQFEVRASGPSPATVEKVPLEPGETSASLNAPEANETAVNSVETAVAPASHQEAELFVQTAPDNNEGRFSTEKFQVNIEQRQAICPAGKLNTQCSRLEEKQTGKVSFRLEWSTHCADCPLRQQCVAPKQKHRAIVVGEHHSVLQARRREQQTEAFKQRMKHRNGIEGTQSELVRGHGLRHARSRGWPKVKLQNYFIGAACNVKRWIRREAWNLAQVLSATALPVANAATH